MAGTARPLCLAAGSGDLKRVRILLERGEDLHEVTSTGHNALQLACTEGHLDVVKELLNAQPNWIHCRHRLCGKTPLHYASYSGHADIVRELLGRGAQACAVDCNGRTPLDWAITYKQNETAHILLAEARQVETQQQLETEASLREWLDTSRLFSEGETVRIAKCMAGEGIQSHDQVRVLTSNTLSSLTQKWNLSAVQSDKLLHLCKRLQTDQQCSIPSPRNKFFISHTGQDSEARNFAAHLTESLRTRGHDVFFDAYSLRAGDQWKDEIVKNVQECQVFICILSKSFFYRYWCLQELDLAFKESRKIIPVYYQCEHPKADRYFKCSLRDALCDNGKVVDETTIDRWCQNIAELRNIQGVRSVYAKDAKISQVAFLNQVVAEVTRDRSPGAPWHGVVQKNTGHG